MRLIRRLPFRGTSQNHADSVQRDERGDDEKDRRTPGCPTRATTTTDSARIRFRSHDMFPREEHRLDVAHGSEQLCARVWYL